MDTKLLVEKTRELMASETCCAEAKEAAQRFLDAVGTAAEKEETEKYLAELEEDIMPIDELISFAESDNAKAYFGADKAADVAAHGKAIKEAGAKYCDCPACAIVAEILGK